MSRVVQSWDDLKVGQLVAWSGSNKDEVVAGVVTDVMEGCFVVKSESNEWVGYPSEVREQEWTIFVEAPTEPLVIAGEALEPLARLEQMLEHQQRIGAYTTKGHYSSSEWAMAVRKFIDLSGLGNE